MSGRDRHTYHAFLSMAFDRDTTGLSRSVEFELEVPPLLDQQPLSEEVGNGFSERGRASCIVRSGDGEFGTGSAETGEIRLAGRFA